MGSSPLINIFVSFMIDNVLTLTDCKYVIKTLQILLVFRKSFVCLEYCVLVLHDNSFKTIDLFE
jgi:hypothetical protein